MGMRKYFFIKINKAEIPIFSIEERKNPNDNNFNDLIVNFFGERLSKSSGDLRDLLISFEKKDYKKVENPHISIHYNPNQSFILIKRTAIKTSYNNVALIKDGNLFAPVILRIFGEATKNIKVKDKYLKNSVLLNFNYNPFSDTLIGFFVVSHSSTDFFKDIEFPANFYEYKFLDFKLIFIYRIFNKPSILQSIVFDPTPIDLNKINKINNGLQWWEICNLMNDLQNVYNDNYFSMKR